MSKRRDDLLILSLARGESNAAAARASSYSPATVKRRKRDPEFMDRVSRTRAQRHKSSKKRAGSSRGHRRGGTRSPCPADRRIVISQAGGSPRDSRRMLPVQRVRRTAGPRCRTRAEVVRVNLHSRIKRVEKLLAKRSRWDGARDPLSPIYHHGRVAGRSLLEVRQESLQRAIALRTKIHREHPELVPQLEVIVGNLQRGIESLQLAGVQRRVGGRCSTC